MSCERYRRRISDDIDGALGPAAKARLERHIRGCPECRACRAELLALQGRTKDAADPRLPESFWTDFGRRLDARLAEEERSARAQTPWSQAVWGWAAAALLILGVLGGVFLLRRGAVGPDLETALLEDPLGRILDAAGSSPALESQLDRDVQASLDEAVRVAGEESVLPAGNDPYFWESLSEAELRFIESELRAEQAHGGVL